MNTAVLLITYHRPENMKRLLETSLKSGVKNYYVAIDGPKEGHEDNLREIYEKYLSDFVKNYNVSLKVWYRESNLGLAVSMLTAIDWFFSEVDSGIILEDDLEVGSEFFDFMVKGLDHYEYQTEVLALSGNQFFSEKVPLNTVAIANYPLIWGWGTWRNRWEIFRNQLISGNLLQINAFLPKKVKYFWELGSLRSLNSWNNSWAILLATYTRFNNFVCVFPSSHLSRNIGIDDEATHTGAGHWTMNIELGVTLPNEYFLTDALSQTQSLERFVFAVRNKHLLLLVKIIVFRLLLPFNSKQTLISRLEQVDIPGMVNPYAR